MVAGTHIKIVFLIYFCIFPLCCQNVLAAQLAVLYSEVRAPYNRVFEQIIDGITREFDGEIQRYPLKKNYQPQLLLAQLQRAPADMVISLGRRGFSMAGLLQGEFTFVSGALPLTPNGVPGVSLIAAPATLFNKLSELSPAAKRVHVVYSPANQWLIDLSRQAASQHNLTLKSYRVNTLQQAVATYQSVLSRANSQTDALWLPLDRITANEKVILPLVLENSWQKKILVFSSKPSHAKRGTLFSVFPDNEFTGQRLVQMVRQLSLQQIKPRVELMKSNKLGVNLRTADHLGLQYNQDQRRSFSATFPNSL